MKKGFLSLLAVVILGIGMTAFAHEVPDLTREGSVTVTMQTEGKAVPGGSLTLYRVGEIREDDGNFDFAPDGDFAGWGEAFTDVQSAELAAELAEYAAAHDCAGLTQTVGADGTVTFEALETGLYLVVQEEAAKGYAKANPFLISVPNLENGTYVYEVDASPKVSGIQEIPEEPTKPKDPTLPQTGQLNWPVPVLVIGGLVLFLVGWALRFGRRREQTKE